MFCMSKSTRSMSYLAVFGHAEEVVRENGDHMSRAFQDGSSTTTRLYHSLYVHIHEARTRPGGGQTLP